MSATISKPSVYEELFIDECLAATGVDLELKIQKYLAKLEEEETAREIKAYSDKLTRLKSIYFTFYKQKKRIYFFNFQFSSRSRMDQRFRRIQSANRLERSSNGRRFLDILLHQLHAYYSAFKPTRSWIRTGIFI